MELRQLTYFVAIAEERSFTKAARRVLVAQPAISVQIGRLEAELGERLFRRDRHGAVLTAAGRAFLPHAKSVLAHLNDAREAVASLSGLLSGHLTVGLVQPLPDRRIIQLLGAFRRMHPAVELAVVEDETDALLSLLGDGELDAAFVGVGPYDRLPEALDVRDVAQEHLVVATTQDHPIAALGTVSLHALREEPMVTLNRTHKLRMILEKACSEVGFVPQIVAESSDLHVVVDMVVEGIGIAPIPPSAMAGSELACCDLIEPSITRRIVFVSGSTHYSPPGRAFLAMAKTALHL